MLVFEKRCCLFFLVVLDRILFIITGNDDIHKSLDEFEIRPDPTTGFHGNRWCYYLKNSVASFSLLFLMGSFPYLQEMMTYLRAWMSSKFGQIRPLVSMATDSVII